MASELDPKALEAAKEWRGHGTTEQIIRAYLEAAPSPSPAPGVVEALREAANIAFDEMFAVTGAPVARAVQQKILALASLSQPAKEREGEQP